MWIINVCLITLLIVYLELIREDAFILYLYMMYLVTQFLFQKDNAINKLFSFTNLLGLMKAKTTTKLITLYRIKTRHDDGFLSILDNIILHMT